MAKENSLGDIFKIHLNFSKFHSLFFFPLSCCELCSCTTSSTKWKLDLSAIGWSLPKLTPLVEPMLRENVLRQTRWGS